MRVWLALAVAVVAIWCFSNHSYYSSRRFVLGDLQTALYSTQDIHCVSVLKSNGNTSLASAVAQLRERPQVIYVGRVVRAVLRSSQLPETQSSPDIVVLSQWSRKADLTDFLDSLTDQWSLVLSQGFYRNPLVNLLLPHVMSVLGMVSRWVFPVDLAPIEPSAFRGFPEESVKLVQKMHGLAASIEQVGSSTDPILIFNWLRPGTEEQQTRDQQYGMNMMAMFSQHGGGPMHVGAVHQLGQYSTGEFTTVAAFHYYDRGFFVELLRSLWMANTAQGKDPGDTYAVITTRF